MNKNIPAFPVTPTDRSGQIANTEMGMTLRDYFAGQALNGELASQGADCSWSERQFTTLAKRCYAIAHAMLAEREGGEG
jgi:hypothetical protein